MSDASPQSDAAGTITAESAREQERATPASTPAASPKPLRGLRVKTLVVWGVAALLLAAAAYFGIPMVTLSLNTVSTDDAYVSGHFTFVAARVPGQVTKVLVDDNNRVKKGNLLVQLDPQPFQVQVDIKQAALATAQADLIVAQAQVNSTVAQARSSRFRLDHAMEQVKNQVAELHASVAALDSELAIRDRAQKDLDRFKDVARTPGAVTPRDLDLHQQELEVARAKVRQSLDNIYQLRAGLGLPNPVVDGDKISKAPGGLSETPADLDQTFSAVRQATADVMEAIAPLGITVSSFDLKPHAVMEEFLGRDPQGNIDRIYAEIIKNAPLLKQANAKVQAAQADLDQANLNLSYCNVYAEIDGIISRRNVNPGNNVQAGQSLMAIRSLTEIWIDANFKETQLADLRIGQPVKIETDVYGSRQQFEGRITGFTMGTGQTLALLPPQNATGNFVKIVQRLPVRIELNNYDPDKTPLFIGTSVEPYVYIHEPLIGNDPGKGSALQPTIPPASAK